MSMAQSELENIEVKREKVSPWPFLLWLAELFSRFFLSSLFSAFSAVSDLRPDNAQLQCPPQPLSGFPLRQDFA